MAFCPNCSNPERGDLRDSKKTSYKNSWEGAVDAIKSSMFSFEDPWGESFDPNLYLPYLHSHEFISYEDYRKIFDMKIGRHKQIVSSKFTSFPEKEASKKST